MDIKYTIKEVVNFAVEIEKIGQIFYDKMAKKTENEELKNFYIKLLNDEKEHEKAYKSILEGIDSNEEFLYDLEQDYVAYLHAFVEKSIFDEEKINELIETLTETKDVLDYAIGKESDSVIFFKKMKTVLPVENNAIIDRIINEEIDHKEKLEEFKNKI